MPWTTPTLKEVRRLTRDYVLSQFGARAMIPNSVLRIMSDAKAGLAHLVLLYIDWLARQLLPDTAEKEWLDRHGTLWLTNSDGSRGRKSATYAQGQITVTGLEGSIVPAETPLTLDGTLSYQTTAEVTIGSPLSATATVVCLTPGVIGNRLEGDVLTMQHVDGVDGAAVVFNIDGGIEAETDDQLLERILFRMHQPPMGGDANDYVAWALAVPGVTRAWASTEMGIGTVSVRFMMDDFRADQGGFPNAGDIASVAAYIDTVRPVAVKDRFVLAPVPEPIDFLISNMSQDTPSIRAQIEVAVRAMLRRDAAPAHTVNGVTQPAQEIFEAWVSDAIISVPGVKSFTLTMDDHEMPFNGSLGVLGTILYN